MTLMHQAALRHAPKSQLEIEIERRKREDAERKAKEDEEAAQRKALEVSACVVNQVNPT